MVREELEASMAATEIHLETSVVPHCLEQSEAGLTIVAEDGRSFGCYDQVIWAVGRAPHTEDLELEAAGVEHDGYGFVADVLPYIILLIILLFKPHGLFGIHEIERV